MEQTRQLFEVAGLLLEVAGMLVIVFGALYATTAAAVAGFKEKERGGVYSRFRVRLGRGILLGLEFMVAGDIIATVAVEPTYQRVGILAAIVLIRTFLSFTLEVEMTGRWPWQGGPR